MGSVMADPDPVEPVKVQRWRRRNVMEPGGYTALQRDEPGEVGKESRRFVALDLAVLNWSTV